MEKFRKHLEADGLEERSIRTYVNAVRLALATNPDEPWVVLRRKKLTKKTKVTYRAALKRWAEFTRDEELLEILDSRQVKKFLTMRGGKPPKRTKALTEEEVGLILDQLHEQYHYDDLHEDLSERTHAWVWPCLSLMIKLALRANVDLTWISRDAVKEALRNGITLTLVTKGGRERDAPIGQVKEELEMLMAIPKWTVLAELISPAALPVRRHDAAYEKVRRCLKSLAEDAGLDPKEVHTHRFRHAAALWLLKETGDIFLVRDLLGHTSVRTTELYLQTSRTGEINAALKERF